MKSTEKRKGVLDRRKYAFIKIRSKHTIIEQVIRILKYTFPEYELEIIDIKKILKSHFYIIVMNLFHVIREYGIGTLWEDKSVIYNRFFGTPYIYHAINRLLRQELHGDYLFSIQDCSLFNGKLADIPHFVYTDHTILANRNYPEFDEHRMLLSGDWIELEKNIYKDAEIVFTRSMIVRDSVIKDYQCTPEKVQCIYYAPFLEDKKVDVNIGKYSSKNILFVGLEWERKGGPLLLSAFEQVLKIIPDARLIIVGCSPVVSLPQVEVIGAIPGHELRAYYENTAIFCLPTRREPFGIVFVEAMRYSLPIVGTNIGAIPEMIHDQDNGYLIGVNDEEKLASILIDLLSDPGKCERMGRRGYDIYRNKFTIDVVSSSLKKYIYPFVMNPAKPG